MPKSAKTKTIYRRSDNGQITTKKYAEKHPKTTEKERVNTGNWNNSWIFQQKKSPAKASDFFLQTNEK